MYVLVEFDFYSVVPLSMTVRGGQRVNDRFGEIMGSAVPEIFRKRSLFPESDVRHLFPTVSGE